MPRERENNTSSQAQTIEKKGKKKLNMVMR